MSPIDVASLVAHLPALVPLRVVARETGITVHTLRRWIQLGRVHAVRPCGGHVRIPRTEIERIIREGDAPTKGAPVRRNNNELEDLLAEVGEG